LTPPTEAAARRTGHRRGRVGYKAEVRSVGAPWRRFISIPTAYVRVTHQCVRSQQEANKDRQYSDPTDLDRGPERLCWRPEQEEAPRLETNGAAQHGDAAAAAARSEVLPAATGLPQSERTRASSAGGWLVCSRRQSGGLLLHSAAGRICARLLNVNRSPPSNPAITHRASQKKQTRRSIEPRKTPAGVCSAWCWHDTMLR
jgi:hypothetical protein